jgi:REP element-mobilizing transposase RayT
VRDALAVATTHIRADAASRIGHASIQHDHIHLIAQVDSNAVRTPGG